MWLTDVLLGRSPHTRITATEMAAMLTGTPLPVTRLDVTPRYSATRDRT